MEASNTSSSTGASSNKMNGNAKKAFSTIQDVVKAQPDLTEGLKRIVETEKDMLSDGAAQISKLAKDVMAKWKIVVPAIAILGVGAYFITKTAKSVPKQ
jgi:flagellar biosynthesis/type III secretory pathway chaperone